ncbi:hypothetical protein [Oscillatoria sp. FACHB-1406]|uniref:hypothetical protein n=1 Tax=Oscillatoria sp. FACHB-1406 TaxID=2692846 RepID=UPI0016882033|nr:hypothetical protein [Oscillatoria sp. FACHB-1406]MBD2580061.1 hypothetical protein [Oscillatoria sp. FACHB-1406]
MTIRELQSLIADIDCVLAGNSSSSDRSERGSETIAHQEILERIRHYLLSIQDRLEGSEPTAVWQNQTASAIAAAVIQQIEGQRATWMQPWQMELETVRQQRNVLLRDIQQLEGQRQQLLGDFLRVLLDRASESLKQEMAQTLERIEAQAIYQESLTETASGTLPTLPKSPTQRLEQLQQLQVQSDRLLMSLDATFRQVFSTLERDIQGYERSLSAALGRIHALGMQDKSMLVSAPPESATDFEIAPAPSNTEVPPESIPLKPLEIPPSQPTQLQRSDPAEMYPFPGLEFAAASAASRSAVLEEEEYTSNLDIESMDDSEIDALLQLEDRDEQEKQRAEHEESIREGYPDPWDAPDFKAQNNEAELDRLENKLFGSLNDPASEAQKPTEEENSSREPELIPVEVGLFDSAPIELVAASIDPIASPARSSIPETVVNPSASEEKSPRPIADTIASLTELLDRAYSDTEPETETYSAVPPGESLIAVEEGSFSRKVSVEQVLEDPQLNQRLDEDLQRFGREGGIDLRKEPLPEEAKPNSPPAALDQSRIDLSKPPLPGEADSQESSADTPPAELLGENLGDIDLEDLWISDTEDSNTSASKSKDSSALPEEIVTDPWSPAANPTDPETDKN